MLGDLGGPQKAAGFYLIAFVLALFVVGFSQSLGERSPVVTMLTPGISVLIMLLVVTREGSSRTGWAALGVDRLGFNGWWFAILGPVAILVVTYGILVVLGLASLRGPELSASGGQIAINLGLSLLVGLVFAFTEEVGWRGYMLPKLARSVSSPPCSSSAFSTASGICR